MVETLDDDELAALDAIAVFVSECLADPELIEALVLDQVRADARAFARNVEPAE